MSERKASLFAPWVKLLRPHSKTLWLALLAVLGATAADLMQPWTLKIVLDNVLGRSHGEHGWLDDLVESIAGTDEENILLFAVVAALVLAIVGAACSYAQKSLTTSA